MSEDERNWLVSLLHSHDEHDSMWRPLTAHALATVLRDDPAAWEKARDDSLEILGKNNRDAFGDRLCVAAWRHHDGFDAGRAQGEA